MKCHGGVSVLIASMNNFGNVVSPFAVKTMEILLQDDSVRIHEPELKFYLFRIPLLPVVVQSKNTQAIKRRVTLQVCLVTPVILVLSNSSGSEDEEHPKSKSTSSSPRYVSDQVFHS